MVTPAASPNLAKFAALLNDPTSADIPIGQLNYLLQLGAVIALETAGTPPAYQILAQTAAVHALTAVREQAFAALLRGCSANPASAADSLYTLALEYNHLAARQFIHSTNLPPTTPPLRALLDWFISLDDNRPVNMKHAAQAFFENASPNLRERVLAFAIKSPTSRAWGHLLENLQIGGETGFNQAVQHYPALTEAERDVCRDFLHTAAVSDAIAREALIALFIQHADVQVRNWLETSDWLPLDLSQRALYHFLAGQFERCQQLDFDHQLLVGAYESASKSLRRRILEFSRHSGQIEWLRKVSQAADTRFLADLGDADWQTAVQRLFESGRHADLWRLAQTAPALWSAAILTRLSQSGWVPAAPADQDIFATLARLANVCAHRPIDLHPASTFFAPAGDLTCLALAPGSKLLAGGTSAQHIYLWELPGGELRYPALIGPATVTRALLFSPDGEHLVAADGDQRIRIFRHAAGQVIKTIEGHKGLVRAIALHPSGRILASAGFDGLVRTWRFPVGTELKRMETGIRENFCLSILADGETLVAGGIGSNISLWKLNEGILLRKIPSGSDSIILLAAGKSSELFASAGRDRTISVWNATSGMLVRRFTTQSAAVTGMAFFTADQMLATSSADGMLYLWSLSSSEPLVSLKSHSNAIVSLVLSQDGQTLITADSTGEIKRWSFSTLIWIRETFQPGHSLPLESLQARQQDPGLSPGEKHWLEFTSTLRHWSQRFDIEIAEPFTIHLGEFDIEL